MSKRVIIITFEEESLSYQAFSEIKHLHMARQIKGEQMAVIQHVDEKEKPFELKDFIDFTGSDKTSTDGFIGMLIGIIGGPLTMLLGWMAGGMVGAYRDAKEITTANSIFQQLLSDIPVGKTGVMLVATEDDNRPLNEIVMYQLNGHVTRLEYAEVEEELKAAAEKNRGREKPEVGPEEN